LKTGPRVTIWVGTNDRQIPAVHGAFVKVLTFYSKQARKTLIDNGCIATRFNIPMGKKHIVVWMYRFMLAGEKDANLNAQFANFCIMDVALLHVQCVFLEYPALADRTLRRLKHSWWQEDHSLWGLKTIKTVAELIPAMHQDMANAFVFELTDRVYATDEKYDDYIEEILHLPVVGGMIFKGLSEKLEELVAKSHWHYSRPDKQGLVDWCNYVYSGQFKRNRVGGVIVNGVGRPLWKPPQIAASTPPKPDGPSCAEEVEASLSTSPAIEDDVLVVSESLVGITLDDTEQDNAPVPPKQKEPSWAEEVEAWLSESPAVEEQVPVASEAPAAIDLTHSPQGKTPAVEGVPSVAQVKTTVNDETSSMLGKSPIGQDQTTSPITLSTAFETQTKTESTQTVKSTNIHARTDSANPDAPPATTTSSSVQVMNGLGSITSLNPTRTALTPKDLNTNTPRFHVQAKTNTSSKKRVLFGAADCFNCLMNGHYIRECPGTTARSKENV
jgi:hypothetical protein